MKRTATGVLAALVVTSFTLAMAAPTRAAENRCGWLDNPTPGNWWLEDRDGTWTLRTQGSEEEPEGMDLIPDISMRDYVRSNGNYGYACVCMSVEIDEDEEAITRILSVRQLKIAQCRNDRALPKR